MRSSPTDSENHQPHSNPFHPGDGTRGFWKLIERSRAQIPCSRSPPATFPLRSRKVVPPAMIAAVSVMAMAKASVQTGKPPIWGAPRVLRLMVEHQSWFEPDRPVDGDKRRLLRAIRRCAMECQVKAWPDVSPSSGNPEGRLFRGLVTTVLPTCNDFHRML